MVKRAVEAIFGLWRRVLDEPQEEIVLRLTLLLLLLHGADDPAVNFLMRLFCAPMLFARSLTKNRWMWTAVALISAGSTYSHWFGQDNHKFLMTYWTLACCLAVCSKDTARVLALNGRLLVALAFSFAVFWKVFSGEFLNGKYFEYVFLIDARLEALARLGAGVPRADLNFDRELVRLMQTFPSETLEGTIRHTPRLPLVASVMAWMTVLIEGAVAVAFWLRFRIANLDVHNWLLMAFCITTYSLAPVIAFGFLLVTMGLAQCNLADRDSRQGYLWTFILVQFALMHSAGAVNILVE